MKKEQFIKKIMAIEIIGFSFILVIVWMDEVFDLPHLFFGAYASPSNYTESLFESILIILLAWITLFSTYTILQRLKYLEGLLPICSFCKRIKLNQEWIPIEQYIMSRSDADFTHGVCPKCAEENYGDILENKKIK